MYHCNMCCCISSALFCTVGIIGILTGMIQLIIIGGILIALINLLRCRIAVEPVHHPCGEYRWAITKNGQPMVWLCGKEDKKKKMKDKKV